MQITFKSEDDAIFITLTHASEKHRFNKVQIYETKGQCKLFIYLFGKEPRALMVSQGRFIEILALSERKFSLAY